MISLFVFLVSWENRLNQVDFRRRFFKMMSHVANFCKIITVLSGSHPELVALWSPFWRGTSVFSSLAVLLQPYIRNSEHCEIS